MIPPKLAVNIPAATATRGLPFALRKPLFAPITQNAPMLIASPQRNNDSNVVKRAVRRFAVASFSFGFTSSPRMIHHASNRGQKKNVAADAASEMYR